MPSLSARPGRPPNLSKCGSRRGKAGVRCFWLVPVGQGGCRRRLNKSDRAVSEPKLLVIRFLWLPTAAARRSGTIPRLGGCRSRSQSFGLPIQCSVCKSVGTINALMKRNNSLSNAPPHGCQIATSLDIVHPTWSRLAIKYVMPNNLERQLQANNFNSGMHAIR